MNDAGNKIGVKPDFMDPNENRHAFSLLNSNIHNSKYDVINMNRQIEREREIINYEIMNRSPTGIKRGMKEFHEMKLRIAEADYEKQSAKQAMLDTHTRFNNNLVAAGLKQTPLPIHKQDIILEHPLRAEVEAKRTKLKAVLEKTVGSDFLNDETDI